MIKKLTTQVGKLTDKVMSFIPPQEALVGKSVETTTTAQNKMPERASLMAKEATAGPSAKQVEPAESPGQMSLESQTRSLKNQNNASRGRL